MVCGEWLLILGQMASVAIVVHRSPDLSRRLYWCLRLTALSSVVQAEVHRTDRHCRFATQMAAPNRPAASLYQPYYLTALLPVSSTSLSVQPFPCPSPSLLLPHHPPSLSPAPPLPPLSIAPVPSHESQSSSPPVWQTPENHPGSGCPLQHSTHYRD